MQKKVHIRMSIVTNELFQSHFMGQYPIDSIFILIIDTLTSQYYRTILLK